MILRYIKIFLIIFSLFILKTFYFLQTNLLRGMAAVMVVVVAIAIVLFIITTKRKRNQRFFGKYYEYLHL